MAIFEYKAKNKLNITVQGIVEADTLAAASDILAERDLVVISVKSQKASASFLQSIEDIIGGISRKDLAIFLRQLSILISASIPLVQALKMLVEQTTKKNLKVALADISNEVEGGTKLSDALARYPNIFDDFFVNMVKSGETSGKLEEILLYLADQQEKDYELESRIRGAMIYPAFIVSAMIVAGFIMSVWVLPKMLTMFTELGPSVRLPLTTRILIAVTGFMQGYWWLILILVILGSIAFVAFVRTPHGKVVWDRFLLHVPIFGKLFQYIFTVRFTRSFGTVLIGGVTIPTGLRVVRSVVGNAAFVEVLNQTIKEVEDGNPVSESLKRSSIMPQMVPQMIAVGEKTGRLDEVLAKISTFYAREIDVMVASILTIIEPLILIILGIAVGIMVSAILLPMYNLASQF